MRFKHGTDTPKNKKNSITYILDELFFPNDFTFIYTLNKNFDKSFTIFINKQLLKSITLEEIHYFEDTCLSQTEFKFAIESYFLEAIESYRHSNDIIKFK